MFIYQNWVRAFQWRKASSLHNTITWY